MVPLCGIAQDFVTLNLAGRFSLEFLPTPTSNQLKMGEIAHFLIDAEAEGFEPSNPKTGQV